MFSLQQDLLSVWVRHCAQHHGGLRMRQTLPPLPPPPAVPRRHTVCCQHSTVASRMAFRGELGAASGLDTEPARCAVTERDCALPASILVTIQGLSSPGGELDAHFLTNLTFPISWNCHPRSSRVPGIAHPSPRFSPS